MSYYEVMDSVFEVPSRDRFAQDPLSTLASLGGGVVRIPAGTVLLGQGQRVEHLYCLLEGTVKVEASDWGEKVLLVCFSRPPTFFGDVEVFGDDTEATCTLTAVTEVQLWRIDLGRLRSRMGSQPWIAGLLARGLAEKVAARARENARNQLCPLAVRYEYYLREMGAAGVPVPIALEQTASRLATSPRHLQRVIRDLVDQGWAVRRGRTLVPTTAFLNRAP
jgi:CRP-like cAMP-binding protein